MDSVSKTALEFIVMWLHSLDRRRAPNQHKKEALAAQGRDRRTGGPFCGR